MLQSELSLDQKAGDWELHLHEVWFPDRSRTVGGVWCGTHCDLTDKMPRTSLVFACI